MAGCGDVTSKVRLYAMRRSSRGGSLGVSIAREGVGDNRTFGSHAHKRKVSFRTKSRRCS